MDSLIRIPVAVKTLLSPFQDLIDFIYPRYCVGCGLIINGPEQTICNPCLHQLPSTRFAFTPGNPVEKMFAGRFPLQAGHSEFYFRHDKIIQSIIHALKYKEQKQAGIILGKRMGMSIRDSERFSNLNYIIPVPMHPNKIKQRGYNQAEVIAEAVSEITGVPLCHALIKKKQTNTQTKKGKLERWQNMREGFERNFPLLPEGSHVLLLDDVLTTGATLEACAQALLSITGIRISIATLAFAEQ
jgi:ComF family protein